MTRPPPLLTATLLFFPLLCSAQTGTYSLEEATRPYEAGTLVVTDGDALRFDLRVEGGGHALLASGPVQDAGPWELRVEEARGEAGVLAGEPPGTTTVHRFRAAGRFLAWTWTGHGRRGCGVFRKEGVAEEASEIALSPPGTGWRETRFEPYAARNGTIHGQSTLVNAHGVEVRVFRRDGAVSQVTFTRGERKYALLLGGELAVVHYVFDQISRNHIKIYGFPGPDRTRIAFLEGGGLQVVFANGDRLTRDAQTLAPIPAESDFEEEERHSTYRNGTRSLPRIRHRGSRPATRAIWYNPPSGGTLALLIGGERVGSLPVTALYRKVETGGGGYEVERLFDDYGAALRRLLAERSDPGSRRFLATLAAGP